jgi:carboxypeptidase Taq
MDSYEKLMIRAKEIEVLSSAQGIIDWDMDTYMPPAGIELRSEQLSLLSRLIHGMRSSSEVGELLTQVEKSTESLDEVQKRNIYLMRRKFDIATKIPPDLVGKLSKQKAIATDVWKKAKAANDWRLFEPELKRLIDLAVEREEIAMEVKGISTVYDSMLDDYERGITAEEIARVFGQLRDRLVPLAEKCAEASQGVERGFLSRKVPIGVQKKVATDIGELIGYDTTSNKARGRIDETEHPFTTGYFDDVRVTVHYYEDNVPSMIYAMLHEGGHALYEQRFNKDFMYQPVGNAASFGIHESMSRFVENVIGRTPQFWEYYLPRLNDLTSGAFEGIDLMDFVKATNLVRRSKIRIEADEVTYSLHIIIRFEIERDLFEGRVSVSELPQVWNEKYEEYLGVSILNDGEGVLQDTHWGSGLYGYFPSYALGNIYDGLWLEKLNQEIPDWSSSVATGNLGPAIGWLAEKIQKWGALYDPVDLSKKVYGREMEARPFLDYLEKKYVELF